MGSIFSSKGPKEDPVANIFPSTMERQQQAGLWNLGSSVDPLITVSSGKTILRDQKTAKWIQRIGSVGTLVIHELLSLIESVSQVTLQRTLSKDQALHFSAPFALSIIEVFTADCCRLAWKSEEPPMLVGRFIIQVHFECFFPRATKASEEVATTAEALGASLMQTPFLERHLMLLKQTLAVFNSQFQVKLPESQQHTVGASYLALCAAYFDTVKTSIESGMTDRDYTQHFRQTVSNKIRQLEGNMKKR